MSSVTYYVRIEKYDISDDPDDAPARDTTVFAGDLAASQRKIAAETLELGTDDYLSITVERVQTESDL